MIRRIAFASVVCLCACLVDGQPGRPLQATTSPRFGYVDVFLDTASDSLAAYQFEFIAVAGQATLVGIEGGEHSAFATNPPCYDPVALGQNRVILAAFSTDDDLPRGKTRIARIHLMIEGNQPRYATKLAVAADHAGKAISNAVLSISAGVRP